MLIDPITWLLTSLATRGGEKLRDTIVSALFDKDLHQKLIAEITDWADDLPDTESVWPEALFPSLIEDAGRTTFGTRARIEEALKKGDSPSIEMWTTVFVERWHEVRKTTKEVQPFFLISEEAAKLHFKSLAERVKRVCDADETVFRQSMASVTRNLGAFLTEKKSDLNIAIIDVGYLAPIYTVEFGISNASSRPLLFYGLKLAVDRAVPLEKYEVVKPNALFSPENYEVTLMPDSRLIEIGGKRRRLAPGDTDVITLSVSGASGWIFDSYISGTQIDLRTGEKKELKTSMVAMEFPKS